MEDAVDSSNAAQLPKEVPAENTVTETVEENVVTDPPTPPQLEQLRLQLTHPRLEIIL